MVCSEIQPRSITIGRAQGKMRGACSHTAFQGCRHGYAGTIYKGQDKTLYL